MNTLFFFETTKSRIEKWFRQKNTQWQAQHKKKFYLPLLRLNVFHRFGQYFYAISHARVVIRSGSSILHFGNKCQTTEKNLEVINTAFMPLFLVILNKLTFIVLDF